MDIKPANADEFDDLKKGTSNTNLSVLTGITNESDGVIKKKRKNKRKKSKL
jgi:hypothetical protein